MNGSIIVATFVGGSSCPTTRFCDMARKISSSIHEKFIVYSPKESETENVPVTFISIGCVRRSRYPDNSRISLKALVYGFKPRRTCDRVVINKDEIFSRGSSCAFVSEFCKWTFLLNEDYFVVCEGLMADGLKTFPKRFRSSKCRDDDRTARTFRHVRAP